MKKIKTIKKRYHKNRTQRRHGGKEPAQLNCSPYVSDKKAATHTCYTVEHLNAIREAYNKSHKPHEYIPWSNPDAIWKTLNSRLVNCAKEDCWLEIIKNTELRKQIQDIVFAPKQPQEWKTNINEWLTDLDIKNVMKQYEQTYPEFKFIGPSPIDFDARVKGREINSWVPNVPSNKTVCVWEELCKLKIKSLLKKKITKIGMVFNLDAHNMPGSHWVSLFADLTTEKPFVFYFDSGGNPPPPEVQSLMNRIVRQCAARHMKIKKIINQHRHQKGNTECGMYSLFFNITMLTGDSGFEKNMTLDDKIELFTKVNIPDKYVEFYRNKYFNQ
jgi:hypothetical protein